MGLLLSDHVAETVMTASPFGRFVEPMAGERIAVLSVVAFSPIDLMTDWPLRIDNRASRLMEGSEKTWAAERPMAAEPELDEHHVEHHDGHQH